MPVIAVVQCSNGSIPFLSQMCPNLSNKLLGHLRQRISQISQPVKCQKFSNFLASFKVIQVLLQRNSPPKRELMQASTTEKEAKISSAIVHPGTNRYKEVN